MALVLTSLVAILLYAVHINGSSDLPKALEYNIFNELAKNCELIKSTVYVCVEN